MSSPQVPRPVFPLSPADLERWTRFAKKGGIGAARARVDKVSQDGGQRDLMFLEGEEIVILSDLGTGSFLGYCEGVIGIISGADVEMLQAKLKRPVMTARPRRRDTVGEAAGSSDTGYGSPTARRRSLSPPSSRQWFDLASPVSSIAASPLAGSPSQGAHQRAENLESAFSTTSDHQSVAPAILIPEPELTGSTSPTEETFPLSAFPIPASGGAHFGELELEMLGDPPAPRRSRTLDTSNSSSSVASKLFAFPTRPNSTILSPAGMPFPFPPMHPTSAFSFSPNSSFASTMPSSVFSAGDLELHREGGKASDSTTGSGPSTTGSGLRSGTNTPGDDPTLAFIFDSYRYSPVQDRSRAESQLSDSQPALSVVGTLGQSRRPHSGLVRSVSTESVLYFVSKPSTEAAALGYGTASALRSRFLAGDHLEPVERTAQRPRGDSLASATSSLTRLHIACSSLDSDDQQVGTSTVTPSTSQSSAPEPPDVSGRWDKRLSGTFARPGAQAAIIEDCASEPSGRPRVRPHEIITAGWTVHAESSKHESPGEMADDQYAIVPPQSPRKLVGRASTVSASPSGGRFTASPAPESPERSSKLGKFRIPTRTKSSPSLRATGPLSAPLPRTAGRLFRQNDPFTASPRLVSFPSRKRTTSSGRETVEAAGLVSSAPKRSVDYTTGISNRDFEEETIQIGKSEFEIVKPLAELRLHGSELAPSPSPVESAPSLATTDSAPATPFRPRAATLAAPVPVSPGFRTPVPSLARSTASLSHFSPPTPESAEGSGKGFLDEYRAREAKWIAALSSMSPTQIRKSKKMRGLVQSGIPSSVRGKVWAYLAEYERFSVQPELFVHLCQDPVALPAAVEHDLLGIDDDSQFAVGTPGRRDLESVLLAFMRSQPQLGYYAGFAQIAITLLTQMPAESAFCTLVALVRGYGYHIFFPSRRQDLEVELSAFSHVFEALEGKLARRMRDWRIPASEYFPIWLSTSFTSILPQHIVLHLLDLLFYDFRMLYRIPIAILALSKLDDRHAFPTRDAVLNNLLAPPPELFTSNAIVSAAFSVKVTDDKIAKARKKAEQAVRSGNGAV
ncbi:hypothetical protein JCM8115_001539 [Rhodotorula mucilaginosa]